ncbi:hypothetical protein N781_10490 [Pontibacillus halophilus JSM 076056 = DSM 19796]|uniref:LysM domain-containing protein n=1 Tax=Pontibacillus halophilus JSM 076056 = DSM 19796 TaxID=1385510 RepID=A0A0A5GQV7_9BACI|nr:stage VI sporulation protein D [Pontibacillus halophilus]KGX93618.1 hypothetical protein N781_10490 [Pontibacillus halophilus JSM 076056 = DSM 19796]
MTYEPNQVFTFDLNESLWFKRGQEVEEFMGISLEPEITIQEFDDYVSIQGTIELAGEYYPTDDDGERAEERSLSLHDYASKRVVDQVEDSEDGVSEFYHRFPVEISVPKDRIEALENISVSIQSFDYELPERAQLKLNATVAIHGINQESARGGANQVEFEEEELEPIKPEETFQFDVKYEEEEEVRLQPANEDYRSKAAQETFEEVPKLNVEEDEEAEEEEDDRWKFKQSSQTFEEFFGKKVDHDGVEAADTDEDVFSYEGEYAHQDDPGRDDDDDYEEEKETEEREPQDAGYLTSMFDRGEEEPFTRMRVCIVQDSDTLVSIAERYRILPTHLSRANDLEEEEVEAGQILYIPSK